MPFQNAKWIWVENSSVPDTYGEFYREFTWNGGPAVLRLSCDSDYTLFVNGSFAESNQYGDCEWYKSYDEIDITPYLQRGVNRMAVLVWHFGEDSQRYVKAAAGLIFSLTEGGKPLAVSDEATLCRYSRAYKNGYQKIITKQLGFSFLYDANSEDNWINGELSGFHPAVPVEKACTMVPRPNRKLVRSPFRKAVPITEEEGRYVLDLGRETCGLLSLKLLSPKPQRLVISWSESLSEGCVRRRIGPRDFSLEYMAKAGENDYTNAMLRLGCRYIEIECEAPIELLAVGLIPQGYPTERRAYTAGSPRAQEIYDLSVSTLELCMMEHYVDTPWREQALYAFDSRNQMLCGYYAFQGGNFEYARSNLLLLGQDRRADGLLSLCFPCPASLRTIPSFCLHYVLAVREYVQHSGDVSLGRELYGTLKTLLSAFLERKENGLVPRFSSEYWNFHDWVPNGAHSKPGTDALLNGLLVLALKAFGAICEACRLPFPYEGETEALAKAAYAAFYDREVGLVRLGVGEAVYMELANAYAVLGGIVQGEEAARIAEALADGTLAPSTLSFKTFTYDALLLTDKEKYRSVILTDIMKNYGVMLDNGATATWETLKGEADFSGAGSLCHGWTALPVYYFNILS